MVTKHKNPVKEFSAISCLSCQGEPVPSSVLGFRRQHSGFVLSLSLFLRSVSNSRGPQGKPKPTGRKPARGLPCHPCLDCLPPPARAQPVCEGQGTVGASQVGLESGGQALTRQTLLQKEEGNPSSP